MAHYFLERWRGADDDDRAARYQQLHGLYAPEARKVVEDLCAKVIKNSCKLYEILGRFLAVCQFLEVLVGVDLFFCPFWHIFALWKQKMEQELRGMFVKVAQVLSVRPEAVPEEYRNEFRKPHGGVV